MTREEAIERLYDIAIQKNPEITELDCRALDMAIKALENIGHLKDRPCNVCEFRKENGCCKWDCVFD